MIEKELIKQLIVDFQDSLPIDVYQRELQLPIDADKIITVPGVRRCGKSSLLFYLMNTLIGKYGVKKEQILFLNFDDERFDFQKDEFDLIIQSYRELYPAIMLKDVYMFFDEVQMADGWEQFVRRIYEQYCKHIFITGSNSKMLSSEISSSLRGRCLQYEEYPLSFSEYCSFKGIDTNYHSSANRALIVNAFKDYLFYGAFPEIALSRTIYRDRILQEYYYVMIYKDMIEHYGITNPLSVKYFVSRVMTNLTKPTSINKIYNEMKSQGVSIGKNSLYEWIEQTKSMYLFFSLPRYTASLVKESLSDNKYYCIDNGLRSIFIHPSSDDRGKLLENLVFLHLNRTLPIDGKLSYFRGKKECDFVLQEDFKVKALYQVTWSMNATDTYQRELDGLLEAAHDTHCDQLYILTMEEESVIEADGYTIHVVPAWKYMI